MFEAAIYRAAQQARVATYLAEYMLGRYATVVSSRTQADKINSFLQLLRNDAKSLTRHSDAGAVTLRDLLADIYSLFRRDFSNIRAGYYGLPDDFVTAPGTWLSDARLYFQELSKVDNRRHRDGWNDVAREIDLSSYPRYYRRNFHYQSGGYLSARSAQLYDHQVEVLFLGAADAMRRQAFVPLAQSLRNQPVSQLRLLDIGCGTGRFLRMLKHNHPTLPVYGIDLSLPYLARLKRTLQAFRHWQAIQGLADFQLPTFIRRRRGLHKLLRSGNRS